MKTITDNNNLHGNQTIFMKQKNNESEGVLTLIMLL